MAMATINHTAPSAPLSSFLSSLLQETHRRHSDTAADAAMRSIRQAQLGEGDDGDHEEDAPSSSAKGISIIVDNARVRRSSASDAVRRGAWLYHNNESTFAGERNTSNIFRRTSSKQHDRWGTNDGNDPLAHGGCAGRRLQGAFSLPSRTATKRRSASDTDMIRMRPARLIIQDAPLRPVRRPSLGQFSVNAKAA
mmetsp:Transcript_11258/g.32380  ORF Transcript_11258/g.32380 Transcript_11258/m.32380 type:complete len:195 (+) Transcript_11258:90-674(+)|eukprot:CAMPEP_0119558426 /NCGR_PEP_ID=MMETSP1352-20130426/10783_1 /TAXON_ID=265584 /ORGANISM="Stauroneis constricta, Strain CCMP1120" /LENGTH=194 /DNA_ID=CAMNT_0007605787 /DNA_START=62 /DNA_END=646 /DNA_ORIENTATION=+